MDIRPRSPLRVVAPVTLVAFALATVLLVTSSGGGGGGVSRSRSSVEKQRDLGSGVRIGRVGATRRAPRGLARGIYVVKNGDTLGAIARKTGVSLATLQQLNPRVDPQALVSGQTLKLR